MIEYPIYCPHCDGKSDDEIRAEIKIMCRKCGESNIFYDIKRKRSAETIVPCKICNQFPIFQNRDDMGCDLHSGFLVKCDACKSAYVFSNNAAQTIKMWNELQNKDN